jgi:hypothetical protein
VSRFLIIKVLNHLREELEMVILKKLTQVQRDKMNQRYRRLLYFERGSQKSRRSTQKSAKDEEDVAKSGEDEEGGDENVGDKEGQEEEEEEEVGEMHDKTKYGSEEETDEEDDEEEDVFEILPENLTNKNKGPRASVSSEAFG